MTDDDKEQFHSNIMWAKGKLWSSVRSACEPLFHTSSLKSYAPLIHESIGKWLALLEKRSAGERIIINNNNLPNIYLLCLSFKAKGQDIVRIYKA